MSYYYVGNPILGRYEFSPQSVTIDGQSFLVNSADDVAFPLALPGVVDPEPATAAEEIRTYNAVTERVDISWNTLEPNPLSAATIKRAEIEARWDRAMVDGIRVQFNGNQFQVAFDEMARNLYAAIPESTENRPPEGMPVRLLEPSPLNGDMTVDIIGDPKFDAIERITFDHRCHGNRAWAKCTNDVNGILEDGGLTDQQKVDAINSYIVETAGGSSVPSAWPSNTVPYT